MTLVVVREVLRGVEALVFVGDRIDKRRDVLRRLVGESADVSLHGRLPGFALRQTRQEFSRPTGIVLRPVVHQVLHGVAAQVAFGKLRGPAGGQGLRELRRRLGIGFGEAMGNVAELVAFGMFSLGLVVCLEYLAGFERGLHAVLIGGDDVI